MDEALKTDMLISDLLYPAKLENDRANGTNPRPLVFTCDLEGSVAKTPHPPSEFSQQTQSLVSQAERDNVELRLQEAHKQGWKEGQCEAERIQVEQRLHSLPQVRSVLEEIYKSYKKVVSEVESRIPILALAIASQVLKRESIVDRHMLTAAVSTALASMGVGVLATLRVPAGDEDHWLAVVSNFGLEGPNVSVSGDVRLRCGECQVDVEGSWIDLGIDAQLKEITRCLSELPLALEGPEAEMTEVLDLLEA